MALCISAGIALGAIVPGYFQALGRMEVAKVNIPVALLIWAMIVPMLLRVAFGAMGQVTRHWRGIAVSQTQRALMAAASTLSAVRGGRLER